MDRKFLIIQSLLEILVKEKVVQIIIVKVYRKKVQI
jgi:hypothetical protein